MVENLIIPSLGLKVQGGEAVSRTWLQDTGVWQEPRALVEDEAAATARE